MERTYTHINSAERQIIEQMWPNSTYAEIGLAIHRSRSTIFREIQRNTGSKEPYRHKAASRRAEERLRIPRKPIKLTDASLRGLVESGLEDEWSPDQISGSLLLNKKISISRSTIYRHADIYKLPVAIFGYLYLQITCCDISLPAQIPRKFLLRYLRYLQITCCDIYVAAYLQITCCDISVAAGAFPSDSDGESGSSHARCTQSKDATRPRPFHHGGNPSSHISSKFRYPRKGPRRTPCPDAQRLWTAAA